MKRTFKEWNNEDYLWSTPYPPHYHDKKAGSHTTQIDTFIPVGGFSHSNSSESIVAMQEGVRAQQQQQQQQPPLKSLSNDVKLCTLLQSLSVHVQSRTVQLSQSMSTLESKLRQIEYDIDRVTLLDSIQPDLQSMFFQTVDLDANGDGGFEENITASATSLDDENHGHERREIPKNTETTAHHPKKSNLGNFVSSSSGLEKMQREEDEAIKEGIKALSIFHDHTQNTTSANHNHHTHPTTKNHPNHHQLQYSAYDHIIEEQDENSNVEEDDDDEDSFYYYESSPQDLFNQRPLPFVVGSVEFLNSVDGGIGEDIVNDDEDDSDGAYNDDDPIVQHENEEDMEEDIKDA